MADYLDKDGLSYFWDKIKAIFATKQDALVSGENIKTINNNSLLGSGNIDIQGGGGDVTDVEVNGVSVVDQDGVAEVVVPTKTSDLTNDSDFVSDASYVHTDNNFTTTLKDKLDGIEAGAEVNDVNDVEVDGTSVVSGGVAEIDLTGKQDTLVSGTNIKTVNNNSLLGAGNVAVQETLVSGTNIKTINGNTLLGNGDMILSASDVTAVYQKHESYYVTTQSSESTIPINVSGYRSTDILLVDINGLDLVLGTDYTISGTNIVLATPISHAGAVVHFVALRAGAVPTQDLSMLKGDKGDKGDTGGVSDVEVNGTSVVVDGVADIDLSAIAEILEVQNTYGTLLTLSSSLTLSTSAAKLPLNTFTGDGCSKSSNGIKVNKSGIYRVSGMAYLTTGFTANDIIHLQLRKNSTTVAEAVWRTYNAAPYRTLYVGEMITSLSANDVIYLYAYNQTGARGTAATKQDTGIVINRIA